ncbi:MAG: phosphate ABC transporter permease subunit PstC [Synergistaceae bacterium]|jgi:phosphate transport system permease protein|nr:phosphate ABC transporter permease subunit PstC [Synergistaceae bacterium]
MKKGKKDRAVYSHFGGLGDKIAARTALSVSTVCILIMGFILYFLVKESLPVLEAATFSQLFFGMDWYPQEAPPALGMFPLIVSSLAVTFLSSVVGLPVSLAIAIFTAEIAPRSLRGVVKPLLELLGFLPSIVFGFLGMAVTAPWLQERFGLLTGLNMANASALLGIMMIPIVGSLADEALCAVPQELRGASYALGATRWETIRRVVLPSALPGILSASLLGVMRATGETMVVLMAAGGAAIIPRSLFDPVRPLTSTIAAEMGETPVGSAHYHALFFAGLILLLITLAINLLSSKIEAKSLKL